MVVALVRPAIIIAQQIWKHRKAIYAVVTAQDRYIKSATQYGRWSKAASYGWRSGAVAGSFASSFISTPDGIGNDATIPKRPKPTPYKPDKTRQRRTTGNRYRDSNSDRFNRYCRRPYSRKY